MIDRIDALALTATARAVRLHRQCQTRVLQALAARGAQVLDLEAMHGTAARCWAPGPAWRNRRKRRSRPCWRKQLEPLDVQRPIFVEAESSRIGHCGGAASAGEAPARQPCD